MSHSRYLPAPRRSTHLSLRGVNPQQALELLVGCWRDVKVTLEEQQTRRQEIAARERVALTAIQAQQELLTTYLERSFDERRLTFAELFARADRAIEHGDPEGLSAVMTAITTLAASSPFRDLGNIEATRDALRRGQTWEL